MPQSGVHSVTVPGAVAGWTLLLERFGRVPLAASLEPRSRSPAKDFRLPRLPARNGTTRSRFCAATRSRPGRFCPRAAACRSVRSSATPILRGRTARLPANGGDAFYRGEIARRLVAGLERRGWAMAGADLSEFRAEWVDPISTSYRGWDVFELPPNGAGIAALMMLNIMETLPLRRGFGRELQRDACTR